MLIANLSFERDGQIRHLYIQTFTVFQPASPVWSINQIYRTEAASISQSLWFAFALSVLPSYNSLKFPGEINTSGSKTFIQFPTNQ